MPPVEPAPNLNLPMFNPQKAGPAP